MPQKKTVSRPEEFRAKAKTELRTGPRTGLTIRIRLLDPRDFIELGMIPGMVPDADPKRQERRVREVIDRDKELQYRMAERILVRGISSPKVVPTPEEVEDPETTISIEDLGADVSFFLDEICILSGLKERRKLGPFRRLFSRSRS